MKDPQHPFPFPDLPNWPPKFPAAVPTTTPIVELASWWLEVLCDCPGRHAVYKPLRLLCAQLGWNTTVGSVLDRLKCRHCGQVPTLVNLVEDTASGPGRHGAREPETMLLRRYR
jgi:hypothetical protein